MNRNVWLLLAAFIVGVAGALALVEDNGYVLMHLRGWTVETSLTAFLIAVVLGVIVLWLLLSLLRTGLMLPWQVADMMRERRARKAYRGLVDGLRHFLEGDWQRAETELLRRVQDAEDSQVSYLLAAISANRLGAPDRRDNYLRQAAGMSSKDGSTSELAVLLTQARIQANNEQNTDALATLARLRELAPAHPESLYQLIRVQERVGDWEALPPLLEQARQERILPPHRWQAHARRAWSHRLTQASDKSLDALLDAWAEMPRELQREVGLEALYVRELARHGEHAKGIKQVVGSLKRSWNPELALAFADLQAEDSVSQLASVEAWLREYGDKPELLLTAGRLCLRNQLWGRARSYLESCARSEQLPEAWLELGKLHQRQGDSDSALQAYSKGLVRALNLPADAAAGHAASVASRSQAAAGA